MVGLLLAVAQTYAARDVTFISSPWTFFMGNAVGGATFCFGFMGAVYLMGGLGFGDVKLMTAAGMLAGFGLSIYILMFSVLTGVAIGVSMIIWKGKVREMIRRSFEFRKVFRRQKLEDSVQPVPFGAAFAGGCVWALLLLFLDSGAAG
jgi:prepilin peptidase CpaA